MTPPLVMIILLVPIGTFAGGGEGVLLLVNNDVKVLLLFARPFLTILTAFSVFETVKINET